MRRLVKCLGLLVLLLSVQQGAVVHALSHLPEVQQTGSPSVTAGVIDSTCVLCPAFEQATTPAFSHAFAPPALARAALEISGDPLFRAIGAAVLTPRSRGPPV